MGRHARRRAPRPHSRRQPAWLTTLTALTAMAQPTRQMFTQNARLVLTQHGRNCPNCAPHKPIVLRHGNRVQCGHCLQSIPEGAGQ